MLGTQLAWELSLQSDVLVYDITCYSWTRLFIRRGGRVWVCGYIQVVPTDCNYAWVISD